MNQQEEDPQHHLIMRLAPDVPPRGPYERRGILYHYTTQTGLLGILGTERLWCTDIRFLNDSRELVHTLDVAKTLLEARVRKVTSPRAKLFDGWANRLWQLKDYPIYVVSFSQEEDLLSQWRAYCNPTGFAIGFGAFELMKLLETIPLPGNLLKCIYDVREQQEHLEYALDFLGDRFEKDAASAEAAETVSRCFFGFLLTAAACFKNPGFEEEKEWRLVVRAFASEVGGVVKKHRAGASTSIPYIEFPLTPTGDHLPIRIIVAGPSPTPSLQSDALHDVMDVSNLAEDTIAGSCTIPYRNW